MNPKFLALACIGAFALAACTQKTPAPAEPAADVAATPVATDVEPAPADVISSGRAPGSDFDQRAFAGTFTGALPCADCPGIDVTLMLEADGSYHLTQVYRERPDATWRTDGSWAAEGDSRLRLDPNSKSDNDQLYAIDSHDRIVMLGADGQPAQSGLDYSLTRQPGE